MMKRILLFFVIVAVFMAACATFHLGQFQYTHREPFEGRAKNIPIWVDNQLGEADKVAIYDAVDRWNYVLNGHIKLTIVDTHFDMEINKIEKQQKTGGWLFLKIKRNGPIRPPTKTCFAFADKVGGTRVYLIRDELKNDEIFGVAMHEIGHLLGSVHNGDGLMYEYYDKVSYQCIDFETAKNVANYQGLSVEYLNYCYPKEM